MSDKTTYQKNKEKLLNWAKEFYENNKERLREQVERISRENYLMKKKSWRENMEETDIKICLNKIIKL